ncbi:hypothetical protein RHGRI_036623 [Rhododendron griersonianum]|uniref:Uncharacterized protein n=1 Tax=Rhododendron griersonianum TaxID=479676 RepID=A0AAV6HPP9_9ERIC|nr:hypothetical protein RHGRI_036623 [Rhododendron griersonianum]
MRGILDKKPKFKLTIDRRLVAKVNKDRRAFIRATPMLIVDYVSLFESCIAPWLVVEVIKCLRVEKGFQVLRSKG